MWIVLVIALTSVGCDAVFKLNDPSGPNFDANLVFVTNGTYDGAFGGIAGADAECMQAAKDVSLDGTFVAWLSDSSITAGERLVGSRGWIRPDGKPVADLASELTSRGAIYPIALSESGTDVRTAGGFAWTGTNPNGSVTTDRICNDWTSGELIAFGRAGNASVSGPNFTTELDQTCDVTARLYCFGLGKSTRVFVTPETGPLAFVSQQSWSPSLGIPSADALCQGEAPAGAGVFRAAIAPSNMTIASRFPTSPSYVRSDGVRIGPMLSSNLLEASPNLTAAGQLIDAQGVWSGGPPGEIALPTQTCGDWLDPGSTARIGDPNTSDGRAFNTQSIVNCTTQRHVYCLEVVN